MWKKYFNFDRCLNASIMLSLMGILWLLNPVIDFIIPIAGVLFGIMAIKRKKSKYAYLSIGICSLLIIINIIRIIVAIS